MNDGFVDMRIFLMTIIAFITFSGETSVAFAHAYPVQETPKAGAVLKVTPSIVSIIFTDDVNAHFSGIVVTTMNGQRVDNGATVRDQKNHSVLSAGIKNTLPPGTCKVTWHALSTDGHRTQGSYKFTEAP